MSVTDGQYKKLVAELKKNPGNSERHYAEVSGIPQGQLLPALMKAEVEADPSLKIKFTGPAIKAARENGVRWPRIAARTGKSVAEVKELFESHTGESASTSYAGRGRKHDGTGTAATGKRGTSGRRSSKTQAAAQSGTSGRRGAKTASAKRGAASPKRGAGRRGTRAQAANPS